MNIDNRLTRSTVLVMVIIAMLMSFAAPAHAKGKGGDCDSYPYAYDKPPAVTLEGITVDGGVATATFTAEGTACPWEADLSAFQPWRLADPEVEGYLYTSLDVPTSGGPFTLSLELPDGCWVITTWASADSSVMEPMFSGCSQEYLDGVATFDVVPTVFISNAQDAPAVQQLARAIGAKNMIVRDNNFTDAHQQVLTRNINKRGYGNVAIVVGGVDALGQEIFDQVVETMEADPTGLVRRVVGSDRYDTLELLLGFLPDLNRYGCYCGGF